MIGIDTGAREYRLHDTAYPFADDYYAAVSAVRPLPEVASLPIYSGAALRVHAGKVDDVSFVQFLAKLYEAALVLDVLRESRQPERFERALDVGAGPALQLRMLRMYRAVRHAEAVDIYDGRTRCSDRLLHVHARKLQLLYPAYAIQRRLPRALRSRVSVLAKLDSKWPLGVEEFGHRPSDRLYGSWPRSGRTLDAYHVGDVFDLAGPYDLVTSFMALEYFDFARLIAKVHDLLAPGGLFCFVVSYWWYPINNTLLYGRFPYLLQQLATDEVLEYYRAVHPDVPIDGVTTRLSYSDQVRPTIADYDRAAIAAGFAPVAVRRLHPDHHRNPRAVVGPLAIDGMKDWQLTTVLARARRIKPDLAISDLLTSHVLMVFRKR